MYITFKKYRLNLKQFAKALAVVGTFIGTAALSFYYALYIALWLLG